MVPDVDAHLARSEEGLPDSGKCGCKIRFPSVLTVICIHLSFLFFLVFFFPLFLQKKCRRSIYFFLGLKFQFRILLSIILYSTFYIHITYAFLAFLRGFFPMVGGDVMVPMECWRAGGQVDKVDYICVL